MLEGRSILGVYTYVDYEGRDREVPGDRRQLSQQRLRDPLRARDRRRVLREREVRRGALLLPRLLGPAPAAREGALHALAGRAVPRAARARARARPGRHARRDRVPRPPAAASTRTRATRSPPRSCGASSRRGSPRNVEGIADFYFERGEYEAASERYRALLNEYPGLGFDPRVLFKLGECYAELQRADEADRIFRTLDGPVRGQRVRDARAPPDGDQPAVTSASRARCARALSDAERRCYEIGRRRWERGDREGALRAFERFLETRREFADVHYMVGTLHEQADDLAAAAESLREALRLNPGYAEAMVALASIYERLGEFSRSRALAERVAQLALPSAARSTPPRAASSPTSRPRSPTPIARRARCPMRSRPTARRSTAVPPSTTSATGSAITLREAGFPDRALAEFARVRRANPELLDAAVQTGLTLYTLGRGEEAIAEWRAVLERDRTREDARMYLRMVARAIGAAPEPPRSRSLRSRPRGSCASENRIPFARDFVVRCRKTAKQARVRPRSRAGGPMHTLRHVIQQPEADPRRPDRDGVRRRGADERGARRLHSGARGRAARRACSPSAT